MKANLSAILFSPGDFMKLVIVLTIVLPVVTFIDVSAAVINVPADYPTIQQGINASADGDTVLVQPGTYVENINFNGHNIVLGSLFLTTQDTSYISSTIIDGNQAGSVVTFASGENNTSTITGWTLKNGLSGGGGIFCGNGSSPNITYNRIRENYSTGFGGGVYCQASSNPLIARNSISDNEASGFETAGGAGVFCLNSSPSVIDNIIENNIVDAWEGAGGGIACIQSAAYIAHNIVAQNNIYADWGPGGGIYIGYDCDGLIMEGNIIEANSGSPGAGIFCGSGYMNNNTILGNSAFEGGGGICCEENPVLVNNTIIGNSSQNGSGDGILCWAESAPSFVNNILWNNGVEEIYVDYTAQPQISYCDIQGGWEGEGNIDCDPLFCDPGNGNYYLHTSSCCIGAGQGGVDIGAFGAGCGDVCGYYVVGDFNGSGTFNIADIVESFSNLKTGLPDPALLCECPPGSGNEWAVAMDVNGSCGFNVADIVSGFSYLKTGSPEPTPCGICPPGEP